MAKVELDEKDYDTKFRETKVFVRGILEDVFKQKTTDKEVSKVAERVMRTVYFWTKEKP